MKLLLDRKWKKDTYTIGRLFVNGVLFCNTVEDKDRGLKQTDSLATIQSKKVYAETAIPTGTYTIRMDIKSPKYSTYSWYKNLCGGFMPRLENVPGFIGILIHPGNSALDSAGCIIPGKNTKIGQVTDSKTTFSKLYKKMKKAYDKGEKIEITIK